MGVVIDFPEWAQAPAADSPPLEQLLYDDPRLIGPIDIPAFLEAEEEEPRQILRVLLYVFGYTLIGVFVVIALAIILANHSEPAPVPCHAVECPVAP